MIHRSAPSLQQPVIPRAPAGLSTARYLGSPARTVCLYWAAKTAFGSIGAGVWSQGLDSEFETELASCRAALGEAAYAKTVERGRLMTMEQAIAYALEE